MNMLIDVVTRCLEHRSTDSNMAYSPELKAFVKTHFSHVNIRIVPLDVFLLNFNENIHSYNIVNTSNYNTRGVHWMLIVVKPHEKNLFFDPLGRPARHYSPRLEHTIEPFEEEDHVQLQNVHSSLCWAFCLEVMSRLIQGFSLHNIIRDLERKDPEHDNRYVAKKYGPILRHIRSHLTHRHRYVRELKK